MLGLGGDSGQDWRAKSGHSKGATKATEAIWASCVNHKPLRGHLAPVGYRCVPRHRICFRSPLEIGPPDPELEQHRLTRGQGGWPRGARPSRITTRNASCKSRQLRYSHVRSHFSWPRKRASLFENRRLKISRRRLWGGQVKPLPPALRLKILIPLSACQARMHIYLASSCPQVRCGEWSGDA